MTTELTIASDLYLADGTQIFKRFTFLLTLNLGKREDFKKSLVKFVVVVFSPLLSLISLQCLQLVSAGAGFIHSLAD